MSDRRPQQLATDLLNVLEEASAIFKAEEAKLQQVLMQVRSIVGPKVAKWSDEDVTASMKAGKLVCRDYFVGDDDEKASSDKDNEKPYVNSSFIIDNAIFYFAFSVDLVQINASAVRKTKWMESLKNPVQYSKRLDARVPS
jgi:hypothetical protein